VLLCQFLYLGWSFFDIVCGVAGILVAVFAGTDHLGDFSRGGRLFRRRFSHRGRILSSFGDYRSFRDICWLVCNGIFGLRILRFWCWYRLWLRFRGNFRFLRFFVRHGSDSKLGRHAIVDRGHVILDLDAASSEQFDEVLALEPEFFRQCVYSHTQ
jgi:hypothetical protein